MTGGSSACYPSPLCQQLLAAVLALRTLDEVQPTTAITLLMRTPRAPNKLFARGKIAVKTFMGALPQPRKRADLRALASRTDVFLHYFIV